MSSPVILKVYVASNTGTSAYFLQIVNELVERHLGGEAQLTIVDVLAEPEEAELGDVLITPTIDCLAPLPRRRVIGMPSNSDQLANALLLQNFAPPKES